MGPARVPSSQAASQSDTPIWRAFSTLSGRRFLWWRDSVPDHVGRRALPRLIGRDMPQNVMIVRPLPLPALRRRRVLNGKKNLVQIHLGGKPIHNANHGASRARIKTTAQGVKGRCAVSGLDSTTLDWPVLLGAKMGDGPIPSNPASGLCSPQPARDRRNQPLRSADAEAGSSRPASSQFEHDRDACRLSSRPGGVHGRRLAPHPSTKDTLRTAPTAFQAAD
jgi:hypothetical protein